MCICPRDSLIWCMVTCYKLPASVTPTARLQRHSCFLENQFWLLLSFVWKRKKSLLWGKCPFVALTVNHSPLQFVDIQNYSQFPQFCVSFLVQRMEACNEKLYSTSFGFTSQTCVGKIRSIFLSFLSFICTPMGKRETCMRSSHWELVKHMFVRKCCLSDCNPQTGVS